jgi:chromosome segregation protein
LSSANIPFLLNERLRLKSIKLAGFKSFVDPTTVPFPTNLVGVVGPNGCGKSNVIDAVRWVMGESSAKNLRAEASTDVIFNGSTDRKPVGQASVELIFDNPNGAIGGEYAKYTEISIRRIITRDAQSSYFLNGTRCRRRDITDIFLGTGLGPRSYSIIEQGMISKLVEARPEELRVYLEEAAGISKYKERRRETENRIKHTRENLDRLNDLREELGKQLDRLQRQSESANKYKAYQEEENTLRVQLLALRWQELEAKLSQLQQQITAQEIAYESIIAEQRNADTIIEGLREQHVVASEKWQEAQQQFYGVGGQVARLEQSLQHIRERITQLQHDKLQAETSLQENERHITDDKARIADIEQLLDTLTPELEMLSATLEQSRETLIDAEQQMHDWQSQWDNFNQTAAKASQQAQIEQTRIQHFEQGLQQSKSRMDKLQEEMQGLQSSEHEEAFAMLREQTAEAQLEQDESQHNMQLVSDKIQHTRHQLQQQQQHLEALHNQHSKLEGRRASLEALQQAALGKGNNTIQRWLTQHQLIDHPRLAEKITVTNGWEKAVETVLGQALQAVCVADIAPAAALLDSLEQGSVMLFAGTQKTQVPTAATLLINKVQSEFGLSSLLDGIHAAEDLQQALQLLSNLPNDASVITSDGIWLSHQWVRVWRDKDEHAGILQRNQEIEHLNQELHINEAALAELELELANTRQALQQLEQTKDEQQKNHAQLNNRLAMLQAEVRVRQNRIEQQQTRKQQITTEVNDIQTTQKEVMQKLQEARNEWQTALTAMESDAKTRDMLQSKRESLRMALEQAKTKHRENNDKFHQIQVRQQTLTAEFGTKQQTLLRLEQQVQHMRERCTYLVQSLAETALPIEELQAQLDAALEQRLIADEALQQAKRHVEEIDYQIRGQEQRRHQADNQAGVMRGQLEQSRLAFQGEQVRQQTIIEQFQALNVVASEIIAALPEHATEAAWEEELQRVQNRIQRLGPINLAAIEEFVTESERKQYLDAQHNDLVEALDILENAIQKIDKETRTKFRETFDIVSQAFQTLFPKVFGGGSAYLELTSDDLLETGVTVMARPPGKKNSTIHLLSGGEKALTAIALVFSIFQLNPAPFCMLDEVDAPLDDANVGRYCNLIKDMSKTVQFIFISHNKLAMEMAEHLTGVTMKEPGVSRLVSVNIEEAIALAEV